MMILLRSAAFNIVMFATGAGLSLYGRAIMRSRPDALIGLGTLWARISLAALRTLCRIDIDVAGREFLPRSGPALIAAQHQSAFDTLVWLTLLRHPAYVLKQELLRLPLLGPLLVPSGFIAVDRAGGGPALRKMLNHCRAAAAAGRPIVIFPEGTRVAPGERGAMQPGIVALSKALDLPIIPAATDSGLYWGKTAFRKFPGRIRIKIYPPLAGPQQRRDILSRLVHCFYEEGVDNSVEQPAGNFAPNLKKTP
jgi:1-acyl-sn-glycerol-3-phosphate acyltransferase